MPDTPERKKFEIRTPEKKHFEIQKPLSEIEPIEEGNMTPETREDLARLVEAPLLEASQIFFDKNIRTWMSSSNKKDIAIGHVHLIIEFDSLSPRNKEIALAEGQQFEYSGKKYTKFTMPVDAQTTANQISKHMVAVADKFEDQ